MILNLYSPSKRSTQSGKRDQEWILEIRRKKFYKEPVMGWTGSKDENISLKFPSKEQALNYIKNNSLSCKTFQKKVSFFKEKYYADNFKNNKLK